VKNGVVTLSGTVNSQSKRAEVEKMATKVPNVQLVVNALEVKNQKASSSSLASFCRKTQNITLNQGFTGLFLLFFP
jgi:hypothetical protein